MEPATPNPAAPVTGGAALSVAVIVPVLNEAGVLEATLADLFAHHTPDAVIVVDGGSHDTTPDIARHFVAGHPLRVLASARGRAVQMNVGTASASADILLFLHADTRLPAGALEQVRTAVDAGHVWGRFDVRLDSTRILYRVIERMMNWRSAFTGIATGDQAIFVRRGAFERLGGYAPIALMEDVELSRRLRRLERPARLRDPVVTSVRRWERDGVLRTVLRMWWLRLLHRAGVSPQRLARWYD